MKMELLPVVTLFAVFLGFRIAYIMWKPIADGSWHIRNLHRGSYAALFAIAIALLISRGWGWAIGWIFSLIVSLGLFGFAVSSGNTWKKMHPETLPKDEL